MLFNSIQFAIFFPVVTAAFFVTPQRFRWLLLLAASCLFYMAFIPVYLWILGLTITVDYLAALRIVSTKGATRRFYLIASIAVTCAILFYFKYFNFAAYNIDALARLLDWNYGVKALQIVLPIGLSFHTFQSLSYVIEVYKGKQVPERHFGIYSLYVMFYPQLVAGPIERPQNLLHQFREPHYFEYDRVTNGLKLMAWGLFKKVVVADRLATLVSPVYSDPVTHPGLPSLVATVFFAFQIYCDFSGYSDIAIGAAQVMGFRLMDNFNRPYDSASVSEFWRRWHISLSTWFRDYLYIPLGGSRGGRILTVRNLFITFLVSGLWHGANWTFVVWGVLHGAYVTIGLATAQARAHLRDLVQLHRVPRLARAGSILVTFALVCFGWVFFRARNLGDALFMIRHMSDGLPHALYATVSSASARERLLYLDQGAGVFLWAVAGIAALELVHAFQRHGGMRNLLSTQPAWLRWTFYYALLLAVMLGGVFTRTQFIYFQF
jgi:alginate O-acetyltransferase complex protein AlgI